jgi:PIN domain nuclease of toxin-antitoxin system
MARYLIDTQVLIWWFKGEPKLKPQIRTLLLDARSEILVSLVVPWEITVKTAKGKLAGGDQLLAGLKASVSVGTVTLIQPGLPDLAVLRTLPPHHRDPFDRMLIAQAMARNVPIVSADEAFQLYDVPVVW